MNKKLTDTFNLPEIEDISQMDFDDDDTPPEEMTLEQVQNEITEFQGQLNAAQRADASMPLVDGFESLEREMDEYAAQAMGVFTDLCDLGHNVEDRNAAPIFDSASKMLSAALQAKQAKLDKKIKMIELQQKQAKLELDAKKLEYQIAKEENKHEDRGETFEGKIVGDRASMLADIVQQMNKDNK